MAGPGQGQETKAGWPLSRSHVVSVAVTVLELCSGSYLVPKVIFVYKHNTKARMPDTLQRGKMSGD
jgi:hypothetical protein